MGIRTFYAHHNRMSLGTLGTPKSFPLVRGLIALLAMASALTNAATLPADFAETLVASGISGPTAMAFAPDGRLFVCEQTGKLRVIKDGQLLSTPFVTVSVDSVGERGLLGVAFDPDFATNQFVYIYYTVNVTTRHNRVSRFTANGDLAIPGSEAILLELDNLSSATNHNGGAIHFGPDGKLYIAVGENANGPNSQTLSNLLGKMLRINSDGSIPLDNPFYNTASGVNRAIWALGLRNPFTFAFQPDTGRIFINDVGQNTWEEINDGIAGANYGWPDTEGYTTDVRFRSPLLAYGHGNGASLGCAITGGSFYNPAVVQFPSSYVGLYFHADYCGGWIQKFDPATKTTSGFATGISSPVDLKVGPDGKLYYLALGSSAVYRVEWTGSQAPQISTQPADQTVSVGQPATFTVTASGSAPLGYQWQRNGADIPGATSASYILSSTTLADSGARFHCAVSNPAGSATSNDAILTVINNSPPVGSITTPVAGALYTVAGALYSGGDTISYSGTGTDPEDGSLLANAFTWKVDFHHDTHTHPFIPPTTGAQGGSFTIPTSGETSANVWYRVYLTVKDSVGLTHTSYRDILPRTATLKLETSPAGLQATLDGQPLVTPASIVSVVGITRTLGVVSPQTAGGITYEFDSWSDGGAATHNVSTPAVGTTYTAVYHVSSRSGTGTGLTGTYYDTLGFTGPSVTRIDPVINFDWGAGSPAPTTIGPDTFSAVWTGQVQAQFSGTHTFYVQSDDGVRLWVNGRLLIDNWTDHTLTENSGSVGLKRGRKYTIRLEYYENINDAAVRLLWSSSSTPKHLVPRSQLYPN